jgi:tRNA dimethylallyltransferase
MSGITHYGIDIISPEDTFTVKHFIDYAVPIISDELAAGRTPIVVGGTHMYIEKLLFTSRLDQTEDVLPDSDVIASTPTTPYTYADLVAIDPIMANRIHPNDNRRISRAIDFFHTTGKRMSEVLSEQDRKLRWENLVLICKTTSHTDSLADRIRSRVMTKMVNNGALRAELVRIKPLVESGTLRWNKGLLQAIGYREFESYVDHIDDPQADQYFNEAVELMIRNTLKYSKQQQKWITRLEKTLNIQLLDDSFSIEEILSLIRSCPSPPKPNHIIPQWSSPSS